MPSSLRQYEQPSLWEQHFYSGDRLQAEITLLGAGLNGSLANKEVVSGLRLIHSSFGSRLPDTDQPVSFFSKYQSEQPEVFSSKDAVEQYLLVSEIPDSLLFWFFHRRFSTSQPNYSDQYVLMIQRLSALLHCRFPSRPDLPYQVLSHESRGLLLRSAPKSIVPVGKLFTPIVGYPVNLQSAWVQGRYESMWLGFLRAQVDGRYINVSDHHVRAMSLIGEDARCFALFFRLYLESPSSFSTGSISNLLFMAFGLDKVNHKIVHTLSSHFDSLAQESVGSQEVIKSEPPSFPLSVNEKPLLVVVSSDLRQHPVGRFWLPIAKQLQSSFKVIAVAGLSAGSDSIRENLKQHTDEWWPCDTSEISNVIERLRSLSPQLLVDLGGHTADNFPVVLSTRIADVQATYLGFYGPTYAKECDWWIVDEALKQWISSSYPGSEKMWFLPGPSLCYVPDLHGLPSVEQIRYKDPENLVYGSFNHTRKITSTTQRRFGAILSASPNSVLQFRSHSFHDPAVRRLFMIRFSDMGILPHQLQPLPYAPSSTDAMLDYGRIHLHLDSSPVSGTTTTLDSLAMGIPVLTTPTPYYAGAISSSIMHYAGLGKYICPEPDQLPEYAQSLATEFKSIEARRNLAYKVRSSPICNVDLMPSMFVGQLKQMLRQKLSF